METKSYLGFLDGIRGFAAFWVFFYHLEMACISKSPPWGVGGIAVDVFMLLSGFLMAHHWNNREGKFEGFWNQTKDFYVRRFFRIAPLYYLLLTIALVGGELFYNSKVFVNSIVPPPWAVHIPNYGDVGLWDILAHYTFAFGVIPKYVNTNILPDWSISLEVQFYLIFPFLMIGIKRLGAFSMVTTMIVAAFVANRLFGVYLEPGPLGNFPQPSFILLKINYFAAGMCMSFAYHNRGDIKFIAWLLLLAGTLATAYIQVILFAAFILFMLNFDQENKEIFSRVASSRLSKFMGDTSYSVYLIHNMIVFSGLSVLFKYSWFKNLGPYPRLAAAFVIIAPIVYFAAFITFKMVETPGIQWGRNILRKK